MVTIKDVIQYIEEFAPSMYQESYDNSGIQVGNTDVALKGILLSIDVTESVVDEAIQNGLNLIISHHPVIFGGIKQLTGKKYTERVVIKAIKNDITIYSCHTNIDNYLYGVSYRIAEKLGLQNIQVLKPLSSGLCKLVTYVPIDHLAKVQEAVFNAGAGHIGNYKWCSFNAKGDGTFWGNDNTNPFVGEKGKLHTEPETRFETIFPKHIEAKVIDALLKAHPYEEVAYDLYALHNINNQFGAGAIGTLTETMPEKEFLMHIKNTFRADVLRHTQLLGKNVKTVALCGGSGSFLLNDARRARADVFISADFKYHQFFDAESQIVIADIGHFESEQFTLEIFYELLIKKLSNFAICFTKVKTNPINYI
ncbi:MAG TPA: Nif3-like dinuclear metal center hexameric protein [Bacteroidales bacterium]|nr:Nif3-like dinuclear metal center hexameric protein [Bacteroidales bacterium]